MIFGKIDSYIRIIEDQQTENVPKHLLSYSSIALAEYKEYLNYYNSWEQSGEPSPKTTISFNLLPKVDNKHDKPILLNGNSNLSTISELLNRSSDVLSIIGRYD